MGFISDEEVFQKHFEVTPPSGVLTEESLCVVCKIRPPDDNWQPQTVARVSINIMLIGDMYVCPLTPDITHYTLHIMQF